MGHRTLSLGLVLRALFLDSDAYDQVRDDDNPFVEGSFLLVMIGVITALLNLIGQTVAWAGMPQMAAIKETIWQAYQRAPWWAELAALPDVVEQFKRWWDVGWQVFPPLFGAPDPTRAALNIILWPLGLVLSWLCYGLLAHLSARLLGGSGSLNQTLGTLALAFTPLLFRGLGFVPYLVIGGVLNTWQLICRYKAIHSVHGLTWGRAFWATLLPYAVYLLAWLVLGGLFAAATAMLSAGR